MTGIIVRRDQAAIRRGRAILLGITERLAELADKGKRPIKIEVSTALRDDIVEFYDAVTEKFDGVIPPMMYGVPFVFEPGASRRVHIVCEAGDDRHPAPR